MATNKLSRPTLYITLIICAITLCSCPRYTPATPENIFKALPNNEAPQGDREAMLAAGRDSVFQNTFETDCTYGAAITLSSQHLTWVKNINSDEAERFDLHFWETDSSIIVLTYYVSADKYEYHFYTYSPNSGKVEPCNPPIVAPSIYKYYVLESVDYATRHEMASKYKENRVHYLTFAADAETDNLITGINARLLNDSLPNAALDNNCFHSIRYAFMNGAFQPCECPRLYIGRWHYNDYANDRYYTIIPSEYGDCQINCTSSTQVIAAYVGNIVRRNDSLFSLTLTPRFAMNDDVASIFLYASQHDKFRLDLSLSDEVDGLEALTTPHTFYNETSIIPDFDTVNTDIHTILKEVQPFTRNSLYHDALRNIHKCKVDNDFLSYKTDVEEFEARIIRDFSSIMLLCNYVKIAPEGRLTYALDKFIILHTGGLMISNEEELLLPAEQRYLVELSKSGTIFRVVNLDEELQPVDSLYYSRFALMLARLKKPNKKK